MLQAQLYFLSDQYYQEFEDSKISDIYWIVPISSRFEKFKRIEQNRTANRAILGLVSKKEKVYNFIRFI